MSPESLLFPTYVHTLPLLSAWLKKAAEQRPGEVDALMAARLAPDMFPLATQVRFVCAQVLEGLSRLRSTALPIAAELVVEGRNAEAHPGTMAEAQARIAETLATLHAMNSGEGDDDHQRPIAHQLPTGIILDLSAEQYARDWALGQFYFHVMTSYLILRNQGIVLGKVDFVAHMLGHIRPGTIPQSATAGG